MVPRPGPVGTRRPEDRQHLVHWLWQWGGCSYCQDQTSGSKHQAHPFLRKSQHAPFTIMLKSSLDWWLDFKCGALDTSWNTTLPTFWQWHLWQCEGCSMLASGDHSHLASSCSVSLWGTIWNQSRWKPSKNCKTPEPISAQGREFQIVFCFNALHWLRELRPVSDRCC